VGAANAAPDHAVRLAGDLGALNKIKNKNRLSVQIQMREACKHQVQRSNKISHHIMNYVRHSIIGSMNTEN
jgi:hypothetical protein